MIHKSGIRIFQRLTAAANIPGARTCRSGWTLASLYFAALLPALAHRPRRDARAGAGIIPVTVEGTGL
jgi:hypothetical protein